MALSFLPSSATGPHLRLVLAALLLCGASCVAVMSDDTRPHAGAGMQHTASSASAA